MSSNIGNLAINLALESAQFMAGLRRAAAQTNTTQSQISRSLNGLKAVGQGLAAAFSVDFLRTQVQSAFDYADAIQDLSNTTGASTKFIQEFRYAAQMSGSSVEGADAAVAKFAKNLGAAFNGNAAMAKSMLALGVNTDNVDEAVRQAADGIAKLPSTAQQAAASVGVFGKSAQELTDLLSKGRKGVTELSDAANDLGIVLDSGLIENAGQFNDKLDSMQMVLTAQFASVILQNADSLISLADGFMKAAGAAAEFNQQLNINALMSSQQNNPFKADIPHMVGGWMAGKSTQQIREEDRNTLKSTKAGRKALFKSNADIYNAELRKGTSPNAAFMQAMKAENEDMLAAEMKSRRGNKPRPTITPPPGGNRLTAPRSGGGGGGGRSSSPDRSSEYLARAMERFTDELEGATIGLLGAQRDSSTEVVDRAALDREMLDIRRKRELRDVDADTGTAAEIAAGKKQFTVEQAKQLKLTIEETKAIEANLINRRENEDLAREKLDISRASLDNESDLLRGELALARGRTEKAEIEKKLIRNAAEQERLQLQAIITSAETNKTEKLIAQARLDYLNRLTKQQTDSVDQANKGPMADYLDRIPRTAEEINDALENVEVGGLQKLEDGLLDCIMGTKSLGDAFKDMTGQIVSGLVRIAIQQAIIKPLGEALFGGGDSGSGGFLSGLFKGLVKGVSGARANGGLTRPGIYEVGERGPELVDIGRTANVVSTRQLLSGGGGQGGINVTFGTINGSDPVAIKAAAMAAVVEMAPILRGQSVDATFAKSRRPTM